MPNTLLPSQENSKKHTSHRKKNWALRTSTYAISNKL